MSKVKKVRTEFKFIKKQLKRQILENNLELFNILEDKEDVLYPENVKTLRKNLMKDTKSGEKLVDFEVKRITKLADRLDKLHKWQKKRRRMFCDWLFNHMNKLESREEQDFRDKYCIEIDEFCLAKSFKYYYDEEQVFGFENEPEFDDVDDEIEEVEEDEGVEQDELEQKEKLGDSSLLATSETEVSEEKKQEDAQAKTKEKLGAFFGVDENCGEKNDMRSES